jgi:type II secretory pathway component PulF
MALKIIPSFEKSRPRDQWPADAAALGWMADNIVHVAVGFSTFVFVFVIVISILSENWTGTTRDYFDKKIPPFSLIAQIKATTLMAALAGFLNAGISFVDAIQKIANSPSPYMKFQCKRMLGQVKQGKRAEDILINLPLIHKNYHWIIDVYSMVASSGDSYGLIAQEIMETSLKKIKTIGDVAANIILVMLSIGIMWVYFGMMAIANSGR